MSFALPTITTVVDKYPHYNTIQLIQEPQSSLDVKKPPTLWQIISKYDSFRELVRISRMEDIFNDPQTNMTVFVSLELLFPRTTLKACVDKVVQEKDILAIDFETARTMVDSVTLPSVLRTTMMIQSAFTRYRTRNSINSLTIETPHCVQFESQTYNRPPFGIIINGKSRIITPDILASNGVIHTIDKFPYY